MYSFNRLSRKTNEVYLGTFIILLSTIYLPTFLAIQFRSEGKLRNPNSSTDFFPRGYITPRQLIFHWGSNPSISWDWRLDPKSPAYLVREEFKYICIPDIDYYLWDQWEKLWPFNYLEYPYAWHTREDYITYCNRFDRVQERANRRLKKKSMKAARAQGLKKREYIPGAWPV